MKKMGRNKSELGRLLALVLAMSLLAGGALAESGRTAKLSLVYRHEGTAIAGAEFELYHVASGLAREGEFEVTAEYAGYPIQVNGLDQEGWRELALTLAGYVRQDAHVPLASGETDASGVLSFGAALEPGLYLLLGGRVEQENYAYIATPTMIAVQGIDLTVEPKHTRVELENTVTRKVLKVWNDGGLERERPVEIEVNLLRDGEVVSTAKLNARNGWAYAWENLTAASEWLVTEKDVPAGYRVKVEQAGVTYTITNTAEPCLIDPPAKKVITGDAPSVNATFRFVMEAVSNTAGYTVANQPMPKGSVNGKKTHDLTGAGEFEFGNVSFMKPGTYVYRLYEDATTKSAGYTYDKTVYELTAVVTEENGRLSVETTARKAGEREAKAVALTGSKAYVFEFANAYRTTTTPPTTLPPGSPNKPTPLPQTGQLWWPVPLLALAGLTFVVIGVTRKKRDDR